MSNCLSPNGIKYYSFPKDNETQKVWVKQCKSSKSINVKNARVCETHFSEESFIRDLRGELLGLPIQRKLSSSAIPTLNLPDANHPSECEMERESRMRSRTKKCEQREIVSNLLEQETLKVSEIPHSDTIQEQDRPCLKDQETQCSMSQGYFQGWEIMNILIIWSFIKAKHNNNHMSILTKKKHNENKCFLLFPSGINYCF